MRERLLTRHFLQRFLDNDLISPHADRHETLAVAGAALVTSGLFVSVLLSMKYLFRPFQSPGWTAVVALDDRLLLITWSMVVMALVAVATWDALALDSRDTEILGPLPIPRFVVIKAKVRAVVLFAAGFAFALNLAPSVLHPLLMVAKLPIGLLATIWLIVVHAGMTLFAGASGFLVVLAIRELLSVFVRGSWFRRVSLGVQAVLVVGSAASVLLAPALSSKVGQWLASGTPNPFWFPPVWFLGLYEMLAGSTIFRLSRNGLPPQVMRSEDQFTNAYESLRMLFHQLGVVAIAVITAVAVVAVVAYAWNSRQLPVQTATRRTTRHRLRDLLVGIATRFIVRHPVAQAGFFFTLQCLVRSTPHRLATATSAAVGIAVATVSLRGVNLGDPIGATSSVAFLALQTVFIVALVVGFRHAIRVPADLRASLTFHLAWSGRERQYLSGVKRAALIALILPTVLTLFPLHLLLLGWQRALAHLVFGVLFGSLLLELLLLGFRKLPFASAYVPGGSLKSMISIYALALLALVYGVASIEQFALSDTSGMVIAVALLVTALVCAAAVDSRQRRESTTPMELDEFPDSETQRLDLAR
jgi:hypothetical protein